MLLLRSKNILCEKKSIPKTGSFTQKQCFNATMMQRWRFWNKHLLYFICVTFLLSACGFHLQGEMHLAPSLQRMYLQTRDPYGYLARNLKESLKMSNVNLASSPCDASAVLVILQDDSLQTLLSVNSTTQTRQYSLSVTVVFEITENNGQIIIPAQSLTESRVITVQSNQILGSSNETNLYYQQMRRILATAIMNRISSKEITALANKHVHSS